MAETGKLNLRFQLSSATSARAGPTIADPVFGAITYTLGTMGRKNDHRADNQVVAIDGRYPSHGALPFGLQTVWQAIGLTVS